MELVRLRKLAGLSSVEEDSKQEIPTLKGNVPFSQGKDPMKTGARPPAKIPGSGYKSNVPFSQGKDPMKTGTRPPAKIPGSELKDNVPLTMNGNKSMREEYHSSMMDTKHSTGKVGEVLAKVKQMHARAKQHHEDGNMAGHSRIMKAIDEIHSIAKKHT